MGIRIALFSVLVVTCGIASTITDAAENKPLKPSVNQPAVRPAVQPITGPQYVREPVIKQPTNYDAEIQQARLQLDDLKRQITSLQTKRDSTGALNQQESQMLQGLMDRKAKAEAQLSELMRKQAETSQSVIQNIK